MDIQKLDILFKQYGYVLKEKASSYRVYLLNQGMYYGAEIVALDDSIMDSVCNRYSSIGYSTKLQRFNDVSDAEVYLFKGFFKTELSAFSIQRRYEKFAQAQVKLYANSIVKYEYVDVPYVLYSDEETREESRFDIINSINEIVTSPGAHLIIIEAAAGFGKTCTAFELYNSFQRFGSDAKPFFMELSRNREAKLFKYVLLDEIDNEYKSSVSKDLVIHNIKKGRIPLIIDGFDELLSKDMDPGAPGKLTEFEQVETMLSTIGELLEENAKVILTSRRTAIFAGPEFEKWVDSFNGNVSVFRFQLNKPNIKQWLKPDRYNMIMSRNVPLEHISNPVLLTYLRNVSEPDFLELIENPETITDKYFEYLLKREQERQNLIIPYEKQMSIFENLSKSFTEFNITSESRSFVKELIVDCNRKDLLFYRELMPTKQTIDELSDTLTNHALLDRIGNKDNVGFVNDFVFGFLLAKAVLNNRIAFSIKDSIPEDLLERAVLSFRYSKREDKNALWDKLFLLKEWTSKNFALTLDSVLKEEIYGSYEKDVISAGVYENVVFGMQNCDFSQFSFVNTIFEACTFEPGAFEDVTFEGCTFRDCKVTDTSVERTDFHIHCYGCEDYSSGVISSLQFKQQKIIPEKQQSLETQILSKYFKVDGKTTKMKCISYLRAEFDPAVVENMFDVFEMLRKEGYISTKGNNSYITQEGINYYHKISKK